MKKNDDGISLLEVIVTMSLIGLLSIVIAGTITVAIRTADSTEGRVNIANSEQTIDTWLPADLRSVDALDPTAFSYLPDDVPCTACGGIDLSGVSALQLRWEVIGAGGIPTVTTVQYQVIQVGTEWEIQRIECIDGGSCTVLTVARDLAFPPTMIDPLADASWAMDVSEVAASGDSSAAQRVVVNLNGGGGGAGSAGGPKSIVLTAGGIESSSLAPAEFTTPSFPEARSRCGGNVTLIIDASGSIGSAMETVVEPGVEAFIDAFEGTPTELQVIEFSNVANPIGPGTTWHRYFDMKDSAQVTALRGAVAPGLSAGGSTNWEEGFFHALKNSDGSDATDAPRRIVFFTDGIPSVDRTTPYSLRSTDYSNGTDVDPITGTQPIHYNDGNYTDPAWGTETGFGTDFHQEAFDRADVILDGHRSELDLTFIGVGANLTLDVNDWRYEPSVYDNRNTPPPPDTTKVASDVIAFLLANGPNGETRAVFDPVEGEYTNGDVADFYLLDTFDRDAFIAAMRAAALKECAGTVQIQTELPDGTPVDDEFVYETVEIRDETGAVVAASPTVTKTNADNRTPGISFDIPPTSEFFNVDIVPRIQLVQDDYAFQSWSCTSDGTTTTPPAIAIADSSYEGFTVQVDRNAFFSCTMTVTPA